MVRVCLPVRLLHPAPCLRLPLVLGGVGFGHVGLLHLFPDYHCCRPHLEGVGTGLPTADDSGRGVGLPGEVPLGTHPDGPVHGLRGVCQPRADDVLLPVHHLLHGAGLLGRGHPRAPYGPLPESYGCVRGGWSRGHPGEPVEPLPHLAVQPGVDAQQERAGEEEHGQPDQQRTGARLHHAVVVWHRRDLDAPGAQHEGGGLAAVGHEQDGDGACR